MTPIDELREEYAKVREKEDAVMRERDAVYAKLKAAFREQFGRQPETADDHFYLAGGPAPKQ